MEFNFAFYLSIVLAAFGCTGLLLAGRGKWYGWAVGLAVQPVWATYAIVTKGYGLLLTCAMYGFVNARNLLKWRKDSKKDKQFDDHFVRAMNAGVMTANEARSISPDNPWKYRG